MTIIQIPPSLGGTDTPYSDGTGAFGMASHNGYGYAQYFFPMVSEVLAAMAIYLSTASQQGAVAGAAAAAPFVAAARDWAQFTGSDVPGTPGARSAKSWSQEDLRGATFGGSARDWAMGTGLIDAAFYSARKYSLDSATSANASETSRQAADADRVQTGLDRIQTGSDKTASSGSATAAAGSATTATSQASLAAGYAASAGSVAQQDLSGVINAALHRSPNAIVAQIVYDTSKDSDGGAWREKCDHLSYTNEVLQGKWLGAAATEAAARAVSGATTGDYFQLTTDGKFYKLSAGSGIVETFRGNTAKFPRLAAIVAEAGNVTIYDLASPGRPMWMRFYAADVNSGYLGWAGSGALSLTGLSVVNGKLAIVGSAQTALLVIDFARDNADVWSLGDFFINASRRIADRNAVTGSAIAPGTASRVIVNSTINAVAMTVLPDAPADPVTGLQVPTIGVMTAGGVSVIKHDGTVSSHTFTSGNTDGIAFSGDWLLYGNSGNVTGPRFIRVGDITGATFTGVSASTPGTTGVTEFGLCGNIRTVLASRGTVAASGSGANSINLLKFNPAIPAASLRADIAPTYNPGYMVGDIRRAWLSDVSVGTVTGANQVTNFDNETALMSHGAGFTPLSGTFTRVASPSGGGFVAAHTSNDSGSVARRVLFNTLVPADAAVEISGRFYMPTGGANSFKVYDNADGSWFGFTSATKDGWVSFSASRPAKGTAWPLTLGNNSLDTVVSGAVCWYVDDLVIKDSVSDRSYKAKPLTVNGTLTKTQVALAAQLVAYSGFSASNYLQEAYSADLDPATGGVYATVFGSVAALTGSATPAAGGVGPVQNYVALTNFPVAATMAPAINTTDWTKGTGWTSSGANAFSCDGTQVAATDLTWTAGAGRTPAANAVRRWTITITAISGTLTVFANNGTSFNITATGTYTGLGALSVSSNSIFRMAAAGQTVTGSVVIEELGPTSALDRSAATGAYYRAGMDAFGRLVGEVNDNTTPRTVTSSAAYNTGTFIKAELIYAPSGSLTLKVNGQQVAQTTGTPLLTLTNASAVTTVGNRRTLDAAWPGSLALVKVSMTAPSADASVWMYEQEKEMFRDGAQVTLPDAGALVDLDYDPVTDRWVAASAANESAFTGLVRTSTAPASAGGISKIAGKGGMRLIARTTTNPGVDITQPAQNLKEELLRATEAAARANKPPQYLDWTPTFTGTTAIGDARITGVTGLGIPMNCTLTGATVTGTGIPAGTTVLDFSGTTVQLSAPATAAGSITVSLLSFPLPTGFELMAARTASTNKQEGPSKDFQRTFNGFREIPLFGAANTSWLQIEARRAA